MGRSHAGPARPGGPAPPPGKATAAGCRQGSAPRGPRCHVSVGMNEGKEMSISCPSSTSFSQRFFFSPFPGVSESIWFSPAPRGAQAVPTPSPRGSGVPPHRCGSRRGSVRPPRPPRTPRSPARERRQRTQRGAVGTGGCPPPPHPPTAGTPTQSRRLRGQNARACLQQDPKIRPRHPRATPASCAPRVPAWGTHGSPRGGGRSPEGAAPCAAPL